MERSMKEIGRMIRKKANVSKANNLLVRATFPNGENYEGEWKNDLMSGKGKFIYSDGKTYEGMLKDSKKNGKGVFDYGNGNKYDGEWLDEEMSGQGTLRLIF
jgi:hypothetical protein